MNEVKYRRPLNKQQVRTLHLLYWYRFCTSKQLARSFDKASSKAIQNKLQILEAQELIGKRYDKSYKLAGRSAEYFITPKGARALEKANADSTNAWATGPRGRASRWSDVWRSPAVAPPTPPPDHVSIRGVEPTTRWPAPTPLRGWAETGTVMP